MAELPTGTVTFLFSDIEGSTRLASASAAGWPALLERHQALLREAFRGNDGVEIATEGDSFFVVFRSAPSAVGAAADAERRIAAEPWPADATIRVRMGLHTGEGTLGGDNYVGLDVHRAARLSAAAHGGQVVVSDATRALTMAALPVGVALRDLGEHRLKDLPAPERVWQLVIDGLDSDFPPLRALSPTNLPAERTSFVGREREIERVMALLGSSRLVTLTGPGGAGKTRLSIRVGQELRDRFPDGVFFVPLEPLRDADLFPSAVAQVLGVAEQPGRPVLEGVAEHLKERTTLLVLDNFEQLMGAAPMVGRLLEVAAKLRVLVTSRESLHLAGEQEFPVPPMGVPDPASIGDLEQLSQFEAVALFIARARAVRPDFNVTNENAPAVAEIAARLEGLPLAIELAGARVKLLGPEALLARLGSRLDVLASGAVDLTDRQRTLRGAIAWSYDLLNEPEQRLFARLSVFAGGAGLGAVEAVCGDALGGDVLDLLSELVDKSLVRSSGSGDEPRFSMFETIREYAVERLAESGERDDLRRRHATYFHDLAERAEPELTGADQVAWLGRFDLEIDNFRAVLGWALAGGDVELGMSLGGRLWRFWHQHSHLSEGREWLERLLAAPAAQAATVGRFRALNGLGGLVYWLGDYPLARTTYEASLDVARSLDEPKLIAEAVFNLAYLDYQAGDFEAVDRHAGEARALYEKIGELGLAARTGMFAGLALFRHGDYEGAVRNRRQARETLVSLGRRFEAADSGGLLALALSRLGDYDGAKRVLLEVLDEFKAVGNLSSTLAILDLASVIEIEHGDVERALRIIGAADAIREREGGMLSSLDILRLERPRETAARLLPADEVERLYAEGRAMTLEQAIAEARKEAPALAG
jgi:predicted ATPase/class 3 adenylate cyclase